MFKDSPGDSWGETELEKTLQRCCATCTRGIMLVIRYYQIGSEFKLREEPKEQLCCDRKGGMVVDEDMCCPRWTPQFGRVVASDAVPDGEVWMVDKGKIVARLTNVEDSDGNGNGRSE